MQIHLSPRHLKLTATIHTHVCAKVAHLEELSEELLAVHVVLFHDERRNPKKSHTVKMHVAMPGPDIHAEDSQPDLYTAIDMVMDKVAQQLRKRKTRLKDKTKRTLQKAAERKKSRG
jgi:putative sigma-54 modulation protein